MVSPEDLTEEQLESLLNNPEVVKTIDYEEMGVFEVGDLLAQMQDSESYDVLTQSIADRSGRITQSTVKKVLMGFLDECSEYRTEDNSTEE